jgi:hypothetical protein
MRVQHLYALAAIAVLGCASSGSNPGTRGVARTSNTLKAEEISAAHTEFTTAYDAVARLRPNWLAPHGVVSATTAGPGTEFAIVYVDGQQYGGLASLRNIPGHDVKSIRYYNMTEAGARYGLRAGSSGVLDVATNLPSKN